MPNEKFRDVADELYNRFRTSVIKSIQSSQQAKEEEAKSRIVSLNITNPQDYIILPGNKHGNYEYPDLLVSKKTYHKNKKWKQAYKELSKENAFMLTIRQFVDFLNLIRQGKDVYDGAEKQISQDELLNIYNEITGVREPYRAEGLDADFKLDKRQLYINYNHRFVDNKLVPEKRELLKGCLMEGKMIDLEDWLENANSQGLPRSSVKSGSLNYWFPRNNSITRFGAGSGGAVLDCDGNLFGYGSGLGVRRAVYREEVKR